MTEERPARPHPAMSQAAPSDFSGIYVATLTPYDEHGRVDLGLAHAHAEWLVENGVAGLCPVGTTGEFLGLEPVEKCTLVRETVAAAKGRAKVIAGIWGMSLCDVERLAKNAEQCGADAVFLPPPVYYRYGERALRHWHEVAATSTSLPVFAYNIPQYSGNPLSLELLAALVGDGHVQGLKDSTGDEATLRKWKDAFGDRIPVMGASDGMARACKEMGLPGFISALANIYPKQFVAIWDGDTRAQECMSLVRKAVKSAGGLPALRWLLERHGFKCGPARLPFASLSFEDELTLAGAAAVAEDPEQCGLSS